MVHLPVFSFLILIFGIYPQLSHHKMKKSGSPRTAAFFVLLNYPTIVLLREAATPRGFTIPIPISSETTQPNLSCLGSSAGITSISWRIGITPTKSGSAVARICRGRGDSTAAGRYVSTAFCFLFHARSPCISQEAAEDLWWSVSRL